MECCGGYVFACIVYSGKRARCCTVFSDTSAKDETVFLRVQSATALLIHAVRYAVTQIWWFLFVILHKKCVPTKSYGSEITWQSLLTCKLMYFYKLFSLFSNWQCCNPTRKWFVRFNRWDDFELLAVLWVQLVMLSLNEPQLNTFLKKKHLS